ncbi:MAG: prepilin-type N-terminal cleavage/methylation domain-containing protein [Syntrophobacteraceae bacterium]|jgi:prepilin-type N-terminal cleavage/methylation domain-containing protein
MNRQRGMTLVELLISVAVVLVILGSATTAYLKLLRSYKTQGRLAESYMANLTGLELLRYDIEMAGFGLPASLASGATYTEAASAASPAPPYDPTTLNDSPSGPPRAFVLGTGATTLGGNHSDVLAIKSSAANIFNNPTSKKWSMITTAQGSNPQVKSWGVAAMDFAAGENFLVLNNIGMLLPNSAGAWTPFQFASGYLTNASAIGSPSIQQVFYIYGLDNSNGAHRMPFNRVDYYLDNTITADLPSSCRQGTFTLYRSTINQADGQLLKTPLIDCVEDFQVAFGLDTSGVGTQPVQWQQNLSIAGVAMTALQIQQQLREVRVFLLYQEGLGDTGKSPGFRFSGTLNLGDQDIAHGLDSANYPIPPNNFQQLSSSSLAGTPQLSSFTPSGQNVLYRWKIVEMAVKPMNLLNLTAGTTR